MMITRVFANALALKAAYDDRRSDDADAASKSKQIVDTTRSDFEDEARKTNRRKMWLSRNSPQMHAGQLSGQALP